MAASQRILCLYLSVVETGEKKVLSLVPIWSLFHAGSETINWGDSQEGDLGFFEWEEVQTGSV